jgi:two-component system sensor histidine kinase CpxA
MLLGQVGERIQSVSELIAAELNDKPPAEWDAVLKRFGDAYRVQFLLFRNDGSQVAGEHIDLPAEVKTKLAERGGPGWGGGRRGPPPGRGLNRAGTGDLEPVAASHPKFMLHTEDPHRYWVGIRISAPERDRWGPWAMTLLGVSSTAGGGLFFDVTPWMVVGFSAVLFSVLFWFPLVRGLTRSIAQMTGATEQMAEGRFDARVDTSRRDELGRLGGAINRMAGRLAGFVSGQKRFLGDTAHELCSPLARVQVALGILEQRATAEQKTYVEDLREEVQHMSELVNELLSFSKAALQSGAIQLKPVLLPEVVERVVRREVADRAQVIVEIPESLRVVAEPDLLQRSLGNLLRNAVRYAADAGPFSVTATQRGRHVFLTVADDGPGVPEEALAKLFDPFYRPEPSRDRQSGGIGLGLAIVKTCVEACRGTVTCRNRTPKGFEVTIRLEAAS